MTKPITPPGEDATHGVRAKPVPFQGDWRSSASKPPGEDALDRAKHSFNRPAPPGEDGVDDPRSDQDMYDEAERAGTVEEETDVSPQRTDINFLQLVREAEQQALLYQNQNNRRAWSQSFRAWHNEHFSGSKYLKPDWRNRSKIFIPKTRSAVRKDSAAVMASLFNSVDAINCLPGDEGDNNQRAAAALLQELVNYRTDRASGKASAPWFLLANGARQDALLTGVCLSKQSWDLEFRQNGWEEVDVVDEGGGIATVKREVWLPERDRPNMQLIPPENFVIDPAADWTNPVQSAAYIILKWPMRIDDIRRNVKRPHSPWNDVPDSILRTAVQASKFDMEELRRARESGIDRYDESQTGWEFQIIWVYEVFMKTAGDDWTFVSAGDKAYLTDPQPVREAYPEQFGERPLAMGYGNLESHRIFPMSAVESWQQLQLEINDLRNLALDATKQNVMPVTKVVRGRNIDLDQVKRRSSGSAIIVTKPDDVTWEQPPQLSQAVPLMNRELELEFDDLAGQFNGGTTENNNALSRTLGGLKLVAGSANAVQEYDIRVWIATWAEPALAQFARLIQYYESDPIILGICGNRAQLFEKYGVNQVTNELLEQEVLVRVSVGLGAGDPNARLQKFQMATSIAAPLLAQSKQFQSGEYTVNADAVMDEVYGAAGYRDGGKRFITKGQPQQNPMGGLQMQELTAKINRLNAQGKGALMTGLAALAKVNLGDRQLEADNANALMSQTMQAHDMGHQHAHMMHDRILAATDHGHRHGLAIHTRPTPNFL